MVYRLQLFKGLFRSKDQLDQLAQAKKIRGYGQRFFY